MKSEFLRFTLEPRDFEHPLEERHAGEHPYDPFHINPKGGGTCTGKDVLICLQTNDSATHMEPQMRKLIMWNLITLDGMFEGAKSWDLDWHQSVWGPELEQLSIEQLRSAGLLVFGRTTYQGMAAYWQTAQGEVAGFMNNLPKLVFSRTLSEAGWNNTRLVKGDPAEEIRKLKQEDGGDLFIFGSADLSVSFMKHDLIDEYRLAVTPIILGHGSPLFRSQERLDLQLIEARSLQSGCVILRYKPRRNP